MAVKAVKGNLGLPFCRIMGKSSHFSVSANKLKLELLRLKIHCHWIIVFRRAIVRRRCGAFSAAACAAKKGPCVLAAHGPFGIYHSHQARLFANRTFDRRLASIVRNWRRRKDFGIQTDRWSVCKFQISKNKSTHFSSLRFCCVYHDPQSHV